MFTWPLKQFCLLLVPAATLVLSLSPATAATPDQIPELPMHQIFVPVVASGNVATALVIDGRVNVKLQDSAELEAANDEVQEAYLPSIGTPPQIPILE